jgi:hypothetical protein
VNYYLRKDRAVLIHLAAMNAETADEGFTVLDVDTGTARGLSPGNVTNPVLPALIAKKGLRNG